MVDVKTHPAHISAALKQKKKSVKKTVINTLATNKKIIFADMAKSENHFDRKTMGSHHHQEATLVPDDKLDRFRFRRNFSTLTKTV